MTIPSLQTIVNKLGIEPTQETPVDGGVDVPAYLSRYNREVVETKTDGYKTLYVLKECVFNANHKYAAIGQYSNGALFYSCFHNSCQGKRWEEARKVISEDDSLEPFLPDCDIEVTDPGPSEKEPPWPEYLREEAFHGLAGEYLKLIEPHSEADPAAILFQLLAAYGNVIGNGPYFIVEADRHGMRMFVTLVGKTSKGRKGTSLGYIKAMMGEIDCDWKTRTGLSSGEGLIWHVRDPIEKIKPVKEKGRTIGYEKIRVDDGIEDKRLLIVEPEFAATLRVLQREGNTLSPIIRLAWDGDTLETLTKNSPAVSHGAHICIVGHITRDEVREYLTRTEMGNGFANRFIWVCVRRARVLPEGGSLSPDTLRPITERINAAVDFGCRAGEIGKDEKARKIWAEVYEELSEGRPGILGAVTARGEAQGMRLAAVYALLDCSNVIRTEHLSAALAAWEYSMESARHIFGDAIGDPVADQILTVVRASVDGLTRGEICDLLGRHQNRDRIDQVIAKLLKMRKVRLEKEQTSDRPIQRIFGL